MKCDCGLDNAWPIDRAYNKGTEYTRYVCSKCDEGDWWELNDHTEVSSPFEDDED
jgi:hypothetical protein